MLDQIDVMMYNVLINLSKNEILEIMVTALDEMQSYNGRSINEVVTQAYFDYDRTRNKNNK